eukprot:TRINITY_DN76214_c0_g1_i1.p2 TRINITY_DN76214_c0_g1~~TRINITY_DN76214_c0_g1_i1.p2  ORF type:complete len:171 (-),score=29.56 TRINITY_DN76214_c0_g1_i1:46-558(-)
MPGGLTGGLAGRWARNSGARAVNAAGAQAEAVTGAGLLPVGGEPLSSNWQRGSGGGEGDTGGAPGTASRNSRARAGSDGDAQHGHEDDARQDHPTKVWEWLDDLFEGCAELYRVSIGCGHSCYEGARHVSYPIKQVTIKVFDTCSQCGQGQGNPAHVSGSARFGARFSAN